MLLHWNPFAAVAAFVAVQAGLSLSQAGEQNSVAQPENASDNSEFWEGFRQGALMSQFGQDWFGGFGGLLGPMSSMLNFLGPLRHGAGSTVSMQLDQKNKESCQVHVMTPEFVKPGDLRINFHPQYRTIGVSFRSEERREQHDPNRGDSVSSRSVSGSSTMGLPDRCIATPGVVVSQHVGIVFAESRAPEQPQCMIVFPSREILNQYVDEGLLPQDIITRIEEGGEVGLEGLTEHQLCLSSGFTKQQCEKLGRRPRVASVPAADSASAGVPIPIYDVTVEMLK